MRVTDLVAPLRDRAVPVPGRGGCYAVVPLPFGADPQIDFRGSEGPLAVARRELDELGQVVRDYPDANLLLKMLNRREAVDSSQIEGTRTQFDELLLYEMNLGTTDAVANKDAAETLSYVTAFNQAYDQVKAHGKSALNQALISQIHSALMVDHQRMLPGAFRQIQNYIGLTLERARYIPPPPDHVPGLMENLQTLLQYEPASPMETSILLRMAMVHAQFEAIHPFLDGNGRTGRMMLPLMMVAEGLPPIHLATFLKARQQQYYDALLEVQLRLNWTPWLKLLLECVIASAMHTRELVTRMEDVKYEWRMVVTPTVRKDAAVLRLLTVLPAHPVITVKQAAQLLGASFPTANHAMEQLVKHDIVRLARDQGRNRVYHAHQILNALYTGVDDVLRKAERVSVF